MTAPTPTLSDRTRWAITQLGPPDRWHGDEPLWRLPRLAAAAGLVTTTLYARIQRRQYTHPGLRALRLYVTPETAWEVLVMGPDHNRNRLPTPDQPTAVLTGAPPAHLVDAVTAAVRAAKGDPTHG